jgi:hypothetical protein
MHVHVSPVEFFKASAFIVIFGFTWRVVASHLSDTPVGQAMAFIY